MGFLFRLRSLFLSPMKCALLSLPSVESNKVPRPEHQKAVNRLAVDCLTYWGDLGEHDKQWKEMKAALDRHPLLGLEVMDEALVVYKNSTGTWGHLGGNTMMALTMLYSSYSKTVTRLRGGTIRRTTTPTLKGGGKRST